MTNLHKTVVINRINTLTEIVQGEYDETAVKEYKELCSAVLKLIHTYSPWHKTKPINMSRKMKYVAAIWYQRRNLMDEFLETKNTYRKFGHRCFHCDNDGLDMIHGIACHNYQSGKDRFK